MCNTNIKKSFTMNVYLVLASSRRWLNYVLVPRELGTLFYPVDHS
jgi:hypothetical protein